MIRRFVPLALALLTVLAAVGPAFSQVPYRSATLKGVVRTNPAHYHGYLGPVLFEAPVSINETNSSASLDAWLWIDGASLTGMEYALYSESTLPSLMLGSLAGSFAVGTPVNAVASAIVLTFTSTCADTETVTIAGRVYEFETTGGITGDVEVDVSGGATAGECVTALAGAITGDVSATVSGVDSTGDTVLITNLVRGTVGDAVVIAETLGNGSFAGAAVLLAGGVNGTLASRAGEWYADGSYLYVSSTAVTTAGTGWRRISLGSAY
jgi:hypothetical protein